MKIKRVWYGEDGETLIERELTARICWGERPVNIEIMLTAEGADINEALFIDLSTLLKEAKRGEK